MRGWELHTAQQSLKAWLRAQGIQSRVGVREGDPLVMPLVGPFKPGDCLVALAEADVGFGEEEARHITMPGCFLQLLISRRSSSFLPCSP